jgi:hypothetical protein
MKKSTGAMLGTVLTITAAFGMSMTYSPPAHAVECTPGIVCYYGTGGKITCYSIVNCGGVIYQGPKTLAVAAKK